MGGIVGVDLEETWIYTNFATQLCTSAAAAEESSEVLACPRANSTDAIFVKVASLPSILVFISLKTVRVTINERDLM